MWGWVSGASFLLAGLLFGRGSKEGPPLALLGLAILAAMVAAS